MTAGTVLLTVGDAAADVGAGGFVRIPAGTPHNYANTTDSTASMIGVVTGPGSQIEFLRGMSDLTANGKPHPQALAAHTAAHGVTML